MIFLFVGVFVLLAVAGALFLPEGVDWSWVVRPGCLALLQGESPYETVAYFGFPPWALLPFIPLALLPEAAGRGIVFALGLGGFAFSIWKLGGGRIALLAFLISPPVWHSLLNANLDWMPVLGFVLPPWLGLFFISVKPQMGSVVAILWLVEAWQSGGFRQVLRVFAPLSVILILSLGIFGLWPAHFWEISSVSEGWNASLWPASIPIGLVLLVIMLRKRDIRFGMVASPCLSPYVLLHAWSGALAALARLPIEMIAAVAGLWIMVLLNVLSKSGY